MNETVVVSTDPTHASTAIRIDEVDRHCRGDVNPIAFAPSTLLRI